MIEKLFEQGVETRKIAQLVGMSMRSVQVYIKHHMSEELGAPWRQFNPSKRPESNKTRERIELLERIIEADCTLTQKQMIDKLPAELRCSTRTISKALKVLEVNRKRLRKIPIERNTDKNIQDRKVYATSLFRKPDRELFFLDETGFNLHVGPQFGYAPKGQAPYVTQPGNRGQNVSVLVCIGTSGVVHWEHINGAYNSDKFVQFLDSLCPLLEEEDLETGRKPILIMDNAVIHKSAAVKLKLESFSQEFKYLPPYTPQLNPIEEFFSALKSNQASIRPRPKTNSQLIASIEQAIEKTKRLDMQNFYRHMRSYMLIAKAGQPFV